MDERAVEGGALSRPALFQGRTPRGDDARPSACDSAPCGAPGNGHIKGSNMLYDVVIVGGGPAGLSAALALGRGRKRVVLLDAGARRNAAAIHIHNFVTRDGTPPDEFRRVGREQLAIYPNVEIREERVEAVSGAKGAFRLV